MKLNFFKKSNKIKFSVKDKPPKKTTVSLWSENSKQTELVIKLRQKAFEESTKKRLTEPFHGPVKLTLTIYDPNPLEKKDRHDYLGDLDALVGGVFECLQPAPKNNPELKVDPALKNKKNIGSDLALIVADDAQIATVLAKKQKNEKTFYVVVVEKE